MRANITILLVTLSLCLGVSELFLRHLFSEVTFADRYALWSAPALQVKPDGAVLYQPHLNVRDIAVYGNTIDYDTHFRTNNVGLIDTIDYPQPSDMNSNVTRIAFAGDSFTAGVGASPWVPKLRERLAQQNIQENKEIQIYNLGLIGAGFQHFHKLLTHFDPLLKYDQIVILAISNDFHRLYWRPLNDQSSIKMCPENESDTVCAKRRAFVDLIPAQLDTEQIMQKISVLRKEGIAAISQQQQANLSWYRFGPLKYLRILSTLEKYLQQEPLFVLAENEQKIGGSILSYAEKINKKTLQEIRRSFPETPIHFIHLPQRAEIENKKYSLDFDLAEHLKESNIQYQPALQTCSWDSKMFHENDPHPNAYGYAAVSKCVEQYLHTLTGGAERSSESG